MDKKDNKNVLSLVERIPPQPTTSGLAESLYKLHQAYIKVGFTKQEAMELIAIHIRAAAQLPSKK